MKRMLWWPLIVAVGALIVAPGADSPQVVSAQASGGAFLITNVRVFDGERARSNMNVIIEDGIIRAIESSPDKWRSLPAIDGGEATLLPGLIDAHTHPSAVTDLQDALRFGVTTVLDMGSDGKERTLRNAAASRVDVADFRSAGTLATVPGGHGTEYGFAIPTVSGAATADDFVEARKVSGSDYLKIVFNGVRTASSGMPNMPQDIATALVKAAHARRMLVIAHVENLDDVRMALASRVDGLSHVWREGGANPGSARSIVEQKVFVIPSLSAPDGYIPGSSAALAADPRFEPFLPQTMRERLLRRSAVVLDNINAQLAAVASLHMAGAKLLVGTDAASTNSVYEGISVHRELELLVKSGLTPSQALTAATVNIADAFHLSDRGRILAGRRADLLMVRGDPTVDITATRDIMRIWRSGVEVNRLLEVR